MDELALLERRWPDFIENLYELCFQTPNGGHKSYQYDKDTEVYISSDYVGGLEGSYSNTYCISVYVGEEDAVEVTLYDAMGGCEREPEVYVHEDMLYLFEEVNTVHYEQINLIEEGDLNMATSNTGRKLVTVTLMDQNPNVPDEVAMVAQFTNVIDKGNQQATLMQLMIDSDIKSVLVQYNESRTKFVDRQILERTGSEVKLLPVTIQDLEIQIS